MSKSDVRASNAGAIRRTVGGTIRTGLAIMLAGVVTFILFIFMQALIQTDEVAIAEAPELPELIIRQDVTPHDPRPSSPQPDFVPLAPPPSPPTLVTDDRVLPVEGGYRLDPPVIDPQVDMDTGPVIMPPPPIIFRQAPVYPAREAQNGVEGDCTIAYDILASGETANARVVSCDSRGFERASLDAIAEWQHQTVSGRAGSEVVQRVTTTLEFRLRD